MKNKVLIYFFILGISTFLISCKDDTKDVTPAKNTGGLVVKAQLSGSTGYLTNVDIGLATSKTNLDNSIYLQSKKTDASGKADFGQLNPGNYYYDCLTTVAGTEYYGEGQIQIVAGTDLELTLTLEN